MYDIKFKIGQKVYPIYHSTSTKNDTCPVCDGKGMIVVKNHRYICPEYRGRKQVGIQFTKWNASKIRVISQIHIRDNETITYQFKDVSAYASYSACVTQDNIFATIEEAIEECERRNNSKSCNNENCNSL